MEKTLNCPYCGKKMNPGFIHQDRYAIKWIPEENDKGAIMQLFSKGIKLTSAFENPSIESLYCSECEKIIIDTKKAVNR